MKKSDFPPMQAQPAWKMLIKFVAALFVLLLLVSFIFPTDTNACIARIKVTGEITYDAPYSLLSPSNANTPDEIISLLKEADLDERVRAIIIEVNSPGGSAVASKEIFDEIRNLKKPTLAYMTEMAASGGYYISAASTYIVANPNTLTGSIGARATFMNYEGLFEKLGLREESIKSGELKDIGAGYRNLTDEEREILQSLIDETFGIFRSDVESARKGKLKDALFRQALDARILSASQAKRTGLIDEVGGRRGAIAKANELAGNKDFADEEKQYEICEFRSEGDFSLFPGLSSELGKSFAGGFISGLEQRKVSVGYN
ncbi:MAG: signal peptide peptidase SppA [Candidatus Micrarchaeota archaeon]